MLTARTVEHYNPERILDQPLGEALDRIDELEGLFHVLEETTQGRTIKADDLIRIARLTSRHLVVLGAFLDRVAELRPQLVYERPGIPPKPNPQKPAPARRTRKGA